MYLTDKIISVSQDIDIFLINFVGIAITSFYDGVAVHTCTCRTLSLAAFAKLSMRKYVLLIQAFCNHYRILLGYDYLGAYH